MAYLEAGWLPIPVEHRKKKLKDLSAKGLRYTGRKNPWPDDVPGFVGEIIAAAKPTDNIAIWCPDGVIGIDVDDYVDADGKDHQGGQTLRRLEKQLGALPKTWVSSARVDGTSGIRWYQIPTGLAWPGKAGTGIDIVSRGYRYAIVWPSYHPETGGIYKWFGPDEVVGGGYGYHSEKYQNDEIADQLVYRRFKSNKPLERRGTKIPRIKNLTALPDKWVDYLTKNRVKYTGKPIDMDSTGSEIEAWARSSLAKPQLPSSSWCSELRSRYLYWVAETKSDATSHDKILGAVWQFTSMGLEGHHGWYTAMNRFCEFWVKLAVKRGKRGINEAKREVYRARIEALRKRKGEVDEAAKNGINLVSPGCTCFREGDYGPGRPDVPEPKGKAKDPKDYRMSDDGNAEHLLDLYKDQIKWVPEFKEYIIWDGKQWFRAGGALEYMSYDMFRKVVDRQYAQSEVFQRAASQEQDADKAKHLRGQAIKWLKWAERSGNKSGRAGMANSLGTMGSMAVSAQKVDGSAHLLGTPNGIVRLTRDGYEFVKPQKDEYVTLKTGARFLDVQQLARAGGVVGEGRELWKNYLETFLPEVQYRRFVQKVMGYTLYGGNPERLVIFLYGDTSTGKSTLVEACSAALGDYSDAVNIHTVLGGIDKPLNPALLKALYQRLITASELSDTTRLRKDEFKRLVGNDTISVEIKNSNNIVTKVPMCTPVIATNDPPIISGADAGVKRRILVLPFDEQVSQQDADLGINYRLREYGREAVLLWLLEGWRMYKVEGLDPAKWPRVVQVANGEFMSEIDIINEFIGDMVVAKEGARVPVRMMRDAFSQWCITNNVPDKMSQMSDNMFSRRMKRNGFGAKVFYSKGVSTRAYEDVEIGSGFNVKSFGR